jgi:tRNA(fMet)-specific endonuclease VapC
MDTDACIEIIRGNPTPLEQWKSESLVVSTISAFEILAGVHKRRGTKREKRAHAFLETATLIGFDAQAARHAAKVRNFLERTGNRIGAYDTLLAGHALSLQVPLLTGNVREFKRVPELQVETWER